ncbi:acid-sensing ion channel 4-like [Pezoporus flaviventris]|uniref:acid-sensing ion channel 4-like n=1 Tax=Pezoporus flaviventris TaxID=889875 RepID=UPI002AB2AB8B|nr:acid-sensing ion channel 4-like [Pezoporus flaviventris]
MTVWMTPSPAVAKPTLVLALTLAAHVSPSTPCPCCRAETQSPCRAAAGMSGQAAMAAEPLGPCPGSQEAATFTSFARSCTLHGLGRIFAPGAPAPRRLLWAGAFLASLGTFLLQAGQRVRHYAAYPRITALDEAQSRVLVFPAITLCNYNRIRRSQLTLNDLFWLGGDLLAVGTEDFPRYLHALGRTPNLDGFFPSKSYDLGAFYQRAGHPIHEMLLRCRFRGWDCGPENFTTVSAAAMAMATPRLALPCAGLGEDPRAEQVLGPWDVQTAVWSAVGLNKLWGNGLCALCGAMGCTVFGAMGCGCGMIGCGAVVGRGHRACPPYCPLPPGAWRSCPSVAPLAHSAPTGPWGDVGPWW